jgi:hypothetical protein
MTLRVQLSHGANLEYLLNFNNQFEFKVTKVYPPNGWKIEAWPRSVRWWHRWLCRKEAFCMPPQTIRTKDLEFARVLESTLADVGQPFEVIYEKD